MKYEKKRLGVEGENKVKRISEIDVTAGYDIVSANRRIYRSRRNIQVAFSNSNKKR